MIIFNVGKYRADDMDVISGTLEREKVLRINPFLFVSYFPMQEIDKKINLL